MSRLAMACIVAVGLTAAAGAAAQESAADEPPSAELAIDWGLEAKVHFRDSELLRLPSAHPFPPSFLPPGATQGFLETVNEGRHVEISTLTLVADVRWADDFAAHAKIDFVDLYDRNPTSTDGEVDVDELWIRIGHDPAVLPERVGAYLKAGKFAHFERQNDRHLESYGLVSTAFNRFEDQGLELGLAVGRHLYARFSATQGNPVFFRDPNALAGDNGTADRDPFAHPNPEPALGSGFPILYDAEAEDLDLDGELETGFGVGLRFGEPGGGRELNLLGWSYRRDLAATVRLEGTFYGGDLDLLDGPFTGHGLPISGDEKREHGANLWVYLGGFSFFGQWVEQELAGMDRSGWEAEAAWSFDLPLVFAAGGRQMFPTVQPAVRWSRLEPEFAGGASTFPAQSVRWEWTKLDVGVRLGIVAGVDLTLELQDNTMTLASGAEVSHDELLGTLRWRL